MTDKSDTFVGLDLDGARMRCLVAAQDGRRLRYLGFGTMPPARWDEIGASDPQLTAKDVLESVCQAEKDSGLTIYSAVVGVGGAHVRSNLVTTVVPVPQDRRVVEVADVANALKKVSGALLGPESTALQLVPLEFVAGAGQPVLNPIGEAASQLEARVRVISTRTEEHESAKRLVNEASLCVEESVLGGFAAAYETLTDVDHDNGAVHLGIGKAASSLVAFTGGRLRLACGFPVGGDDVVHDVSRAFATTPGVAYSLISDYGRAVHTSVRARSYVFVPTTGPLYEREFGRPWPCSMLDKLIALRIEECIVMARDELQRAGLANGEVRSLVISGDLAALPGIAELAQSITGLRSRIGAPSHLAGLPQELRNPEWACAVGLVRYAHRLADRPRDTSENRPTFEQTRRQEKAA